jgi:phosphinothricin acetyltransferase
MRVRAAVPGDVAELAELYNHYIRSSPVTFDLEPQSLEVRQAWFEDFAPHSPHQLFVAEESGALSGFAGSRSFRTKAAYASTIEVTVYCAPRSTGRGVGRALYHALFDALKGQDLHRAVAGVTLPNPASIALHQAFGFRSVGTFSEVGYKQGRYWDVCWLEKAL